ncbi:MAG TPA: response regulator transcription factor [Flavipsychrobacter sp.]|nr:response regulator transcription factor [Flavipsychrobacter sp.]
MENTRPFYLIEDHVLVREGFKKLIEELGPYQVVREFDNGRQLIETYPFNPPPELLILDIEMPEMNGKAVMHWLKTHDIKIPVLLLSCEENESLIISLFRLGVRGYLHKQCSAATLAKAIEDILHTGYYHDEMFTKALNTSDKDACNKYASLLTNRELEFLRLACSDREYNYDEIGKMMDIHTRTVNKYREAVFDKFGVKTRAGLILFAIKHKLLNC